MFGIITVNDNAPGLDNALHDEISGCIIPTHSVAVVQVLEPFYRASRGHNHQMLVAHWRKLLQRFVLCHAGRSPEDHLGFDPLGQWISPFELRQITAQHLLSVVLPDL